MMMMMIDKKLTKIAQNKFRVSLPLIINLILAIILMILSISQSFPINEAGDGIILGAFFTGWQRNVCLNRMIQFLSPFVFEFRVDTFNLDFGMMGCPWRIRNTIYRLTLICLIIIISLWMLVILLLNSNNKKQETTTTTTTKVKGSHVWYLLYWFKYLLFLAMVILFILDCDGAYAGYNACRANFDITGFGPLVLSLLGAAFTTTTAPQWPAGSSVADNGDGNLAVTQFKIADHCYITPAIYILLCDFIIIIITYISYKLSKFYTFNNNHDEDDDEDDDDDNDKYKYRQEQEKKNNKQKKKRFRFHKTKRLDEGSTNNNDVNDKAHEISNNPFDTIEEEMFEPPSWNKRKPTYEQNYS